MDAEHLTNIPTAPQQQQQQPTSLLSDVVTVISGARQSANQEFNKFWDKYISKKLADNDTSSSSQYLPIHFTEYDLACIKEGRNIQGRLIPVSNRSQEEEEVCLMDKDMARSSEKRRISLTEDDLSPNILPRTKASKRHAPSPSAQEASYFSSFSIPSPQPVFSNSPPPTFSTPEKATPPPELSSITSSPYRSASRINTMRTSLSPIRSPARKTTIRTSLTPTQSPARRTTIQTSVSPIKYSPERLKNPIVTGSSKSVQRLASEIAIKLSPGGSNPFSPKKEYAATTVNNADPFQSTPLVKTSTDISARKIAVPKTRKLITEEEDECITRMQSKLMKQVKDHISGSQGKVVEKNKEDERVAKHVQKTTIGEEKEEEEVDKRLNNLQNRIYAIQSAVAEFISSPVEMFSPKPIRTPCNKKIAALEAQVDPPLTTNKSTASVDISDDDNIQLLDVKDIPSPPLPSYFALNHVPSPPPRPEAIVSSPKKTFSTSPLRSLPADPFGRDSILRKQAAVTENEAYRFSSYSKARDHVKSETQLSVISKDNASHGNSSPNKTEPTLTHKLKMRSLVNAIPFCKLRKADTITGPDGITRPNPFWKEIYGGRK